MTARTSFLASVDHRIARATEVIADLYEIDEQDAHARLSGVAERAGVSSGEIARGVLLFHTDEGLPQPPA